MIRPRFGKLAYFHIIFTALAIVSCTHYDWSSKSGSRDYDSDRDTSFLPPESYEEEVAYGEREPIERENCEESGAVIPFSSPYQPNAQIRTQVSNDLSNLSITDKVGQMVGTDAAGGANTSDIFRQMDNVEKGIRGIKFRDGPRGLNLVTDRQPGHNGYATAFPVSMSRGASFDMNLEYRIGQAHASETVASGRHLMLAPTVNLLRHPAWGRAQETYGEDPYHLGRMGTAYTLGVQQYIPACVKHYAGNNVENNRAGLNSEMDEQTLREIYSRAFEMIIKDGGVACVMAAYNLLNGEKCTENEHLLTTILRDDFGFEGFVLSDWWAMSNGNIATRLPGEYQTVAIKGVTAGMDMELPWALNYRELPSLVAGGQVSETYINQSVSRILEQKYRFKIADLNEKQFGLKPSTVEWDRQTTTIIDTGDVHLKLAEEAALKGAVLLKNENNTLPIKPTGTSFTVAVLGATVDFTLTAISAAGQVNYAVDVVTGDMGSSMVVSDPTRSTGPFDGIKAVASEIDPNINVIRGSVAADAAGADFVVVVAGLNAMDEGEEYTGAGDRSSFALDAKIASTPQIDLIQSAAALGKPMVVVLEGGSVIDMPWLEEVPAVLMAWYPGMAGGKAIGQLLFGQVSPSGRLPISWPAAWNDAPVFNPGRIIDHSYFAGYRYYEQQNKKVLFPFGYGLSYSTFEHLNLEMPCSAVVSDGMAPVSVDISNRGETQADEVVFLFTSYPDSSNEKLRIKQLKGFYRVSLMPGQTKRVTMPLRIEDLKYFDMASNSWKVEPGELEVSIASDAETTLSSPSGKLLSQRMTIVVN